MTETQAILLDIEGTTTPIDFVYHVLFPYARAHFPDWLRRNRDNPEVQSDIHRLRGEHIEDPGQPPPWDDAAELDSSIEYLLWLMDCDRKSTALKSLQGRVWEEGYVKGQFLSVVYSDVRPAFEHWKKSGLCIAIYSSGSVAAQKLLFGHSTAGDLTPYIDNWFDTRIGAKREVLSYRKIAEALGIAAGEILFVSDVTAELDAAAQAGMETALSIRPGNPPQPGAERFNAITSFDKILK